MSSNDLDYGRRQDLKELADAIQNAKTHAEREHYEKIAYRILNESPRIKYLRKELIGATRAGDRRQVRRVLERIHYVRQDETYGGSWGNNKGNRNVN